jgi:hypothetical protein
VAILNNRGRGENGRPGCGATEAASPRLFLLFLVLSIPLAPLQAQPSREYQIKAVFLFNFAQFTEWPTNAFAGPGEPIVIGVLGSNPFGDFLEDTVKNESVRGRHLLVQRYKTVEEIQTCHILYIGQSEARRLERVVAKLKGKPMLTVSDIPDAARGGVAIGLITERNHIKLQIGLAAIRSASLTVSSKLLRLGQIVKDKES